MGEMYDLVVVGGNHAGLSVAIEAREAGLNRVLLIHPDSEVAAPAVVSQHELEVATTVRVDSVDSRPDGPETLVLGTTRGELTASTVVIALRPEPVSSPPKHPVRSDKLVYFGAVPGDMRDEHVLVVGHTEDAAETAISLVGTGAEVVLALEGADLAGLSRLSRRSLFRLEAERSLTVLWRSPVEALDELNGQVVAVFADGRTPDLQFDHVVYRMEPATPSAGLHDLGISVGSIPEQRLWWTHPVVGESGSSGVSVELPGRVWEAVRRARFAHLQPPSGRPRVWRPDDADRIDELRSLHYNASITYFHREQPGLWRIRIQPDDGETAYLAGQYATLALGYWEPRIDSARDRALERRWGRLVRRSYSISSQVLDDDGELVDPAQSDNLEFYVVLVEPIAGNVPGLTPRLALKQRGDRIHLGARIAGRYTLAPITSSDQTVVMIATGTGEAPHNSMATELLRTGHRGPIVTVTCVRYRQDLGYLSEHRVLEDRFSNYHYLPLVTRDSDTERRYPQDVIAGELLGKEFGVELDPATAHVFLCGNPAMIGIPRWTDEGEPMFDIPVGVCQLLVERGFTLDRRGVAGNVHYEKYW
jgi:ferredoxin/flavodoxin---NADP+ reductase